MNLRKLGSQPFNGHFNSAFNGFRPGIFNRPGAHVAFLAGIEGKITEAGGLTQRIFRKFSPFPGPGNKTTKRPPMAGAWGLAGQGSGHGAYPVPGQADRLGVRGLPGCCTG